MSKFVRAALVAIAVLAAGQAAAETRDPHRWFYQNLTAAAVNSRGAINRTQVGYMYKLWGNPTPDESAPLGARLKQNTYLKVALTNQLSPAYDRPGLMIEAMPLAIVRLAARVEGAAYWDAFSLLSSFDSPTATHDLQTQDDAKASYFATGWSARFDARLQFKLGPVAVRSELRAEYFDLDLKDNDPVFYEPVMDTLIADEGWGLVTDSDVLYVINPHVIVGVRHTYTKAFYEDADFLPGEDPDTAITNGEQHRIGPAFVYKIDPTARGGRFNDPTVFLITGWWLKHRYRTGNPTSQALPYMALGFAFNGDL